MLAQAVQNTETEHKRNMSPQVRKIMEREIQDESNLTMVMDEERERGHYDRVCELQSDVVYTRAKAEVQMNATILSEKMHPEVLANIDDIVTYHWDRRKKQIQHNKVIDML